MNSKSIQCFYAWLYLFNIVRRKNLLLKTIANGQNNTDLMYKFKSNDMYSITHRPKINNEQKSSFNYSESKGDNFSSYLQ